MRPLCVFKIKILNRILSRVSLYFVFFLFLSNVSYALDQVTLSLKGVHQFQYAGYYVALEQGFYKDVGLEVNIIEADASTALESVLTGRANFAVGDSRLLLDRLQGKPVVVLASIFQHSSNALVIPKQQVTNGIRSITGKKVLLDERADDLKAYLAQENLIITKVSKPANEIHIEDLVSGVVDATSILISQDIKRLDDLNFGYQLFSPKSVGIDFYGDNLFTSEKEIASSPQQVAGFLKASLRGWRYALQHSDDTVNLIFDKYSKYYSKAELRYEAKKVLSLISPMTADIGHMDLEKWRNIAETYVELGTIPAAFSLDGFFYQAEAKTSTLWWYLLLAVLICILFLICVMQLRLIEREREKSHKTIQFKDLLLSAQQKASKEGMLTVDADGSIVSINQRLIDVLDMNEASTESLIGNRLLNIFSEKVIDYQAFVNKVEALEKERGVTPIEEVTIKGGQVLEYYSSRLVSVDGHFFGKLWSFRDVTERKESDQSIWNQANLDFLTKLPNRYMLFDRLASQLQLAQRSKTKVAVLFLDLDKFKEINDTLGHSFGDSLLKETAKRLKKCVRNTDIVSRLGGDEFTVVISNLKEVRIVDRITEQIIRSLTEPFCFGNETATISTSVGIALFPDDGSDADTLMKKSDQAMYVIKENGRNGYQYFTEQMQTAAAARQSLTYDLKQALNKGELQLYYQPIVDFSSGKIEAIEALIRWVHPEKGVIHPSGFMNVAEEIGMIGEIGDWVFEHACRQLCEWRSLYNDDLKMSINVSLSQFCKRKNFGQWKQILETLHLPGNAVVVEIKECTLMEEEHEVLEKLQFLSDLGMNLALDDFGTGYSSLSYLSQCNIALLKIDESFISKLSLHSRHLALCEGIIAMVHKLGIRVIAEGIESKEQLDMLTQVECDLGQGFYIQAPLTTADFEKLLNSPSSLLLDTNDSIYSEQLKQM